jgi:hypothetical protein
MLMFSQDEGRLLEDNLEILCLGDRLEGVKRSTIIQARNLTKIYSS